MATRSEEKVSAKESMERLKSAVNENWDGERISSYLTFVNRFHQYSAMNRLMILAQKPDATLCASFTTWKQFGRTPNRGTGIKIFSPVQKNFTKQDDDGNDIIGPDGEPVVIRYMTYMQKYCTFDVSDTEGDPLPKPAEMEGEPVEGFQESMDRVNSELKSIIEEGEVVSTVLGETSIVRSDASPLERSIEHAKIAAYGLVDDQVRKDDRLAAEWIASAASFAIAARYGLDIRDYTRETLPEPPSGMDLDKMLVSAAKIAETIDGMEQGAPQSWAMAWGMGG